MKVALIHDWLTGMRGGEKCLEVLCEIFPQAEIFALLHVPGSVSPAIERLPIHTSFVQKLPFASGKYRRYLPLFPRAIERFDLSEYDLVISCSHCVAKGARPRAGAVHVCYCFTPMRYVWDMYDEYFGPGRAGLFTRKAIAYFAPKLRKWDVETADRVTHFVAISDHVADRIRRHYGRESAVIHPPVDAARFRISAERGDYYLMVSALAPYKRVDTAVEAFAKLGLPLKIIGSGQDEARLRKLASDNVEFLGWQPDAAVAEHYSRCRAFVFPGEEDFGITPLEAMASGAPVIALRRGGALETVIGPDADRPATGVFFDEPTPGCLAEAVTWFQQHQSLFEPEALRGRALEFDRPIFRQRLADYIRSVGPDAPTHP